MREFLEDPSPDKREHLVDRLLDGPHYVRHFTNVCAPLFVPDVNEQQLRFFVPSFENWLRQRLQDNVGYDRHRARYPHTAARDHGWSAGPRSSQPGSAQPRCLLPGHELKPENLAASTSRCFSASSSSAPVSRPPVRDNGAASSSGNTPRSSRARRARTAIFGRIARGRRPSRNKNHRHRQDRPGPPARRQPARLEGRRQHAGHAGRLDHDLGNPFFARAAVNRLWAQFFGIGWSIRSMSRRSKPAQPPGAARRAGPAVRRPPV